MAKRILIADDSLTIQRAFAMTFGAEDLALTAARSADEGLNLARQTRPDLVIADAGMPGRSGYELCAAIKADAGLRATPVYILASTQQPYDEAKGQQVGADGHLLKPWDTGLLIDKVREAMGRGPSTTTASSGAFAVSATVVSPAPAAMRAPAPAPAPARDDEYGDIAVDTSREVPRQTTTPSMPAPQFMPPAAPLRPTTQGMPSPPPQQATAAPSGQSGASLRPSLIPGVRPGMAPPARPGTVPARPTGPGPAGGVPPRPAPPAVGRTLMGLPAANLPIPGSTRPGAAAMPSSMTSPLARPPTGPISPLHARTAAPAAPAHAPAPVHAPAPAPHVPAHAPAPAPAPAPAHAPPAAVAAMASVVDQKVAAFAARGPEYEAIAKLSREVIEQIVWEIVPELADAIIREHMEKRGRA